jgi:spore coat protein CotH
MVGYRIRSSKGPPLVKRLRGVSPTRNRLGLSGLIALAALAASSVGAPAAGADEAAWLFDPNTVVEIDLGLSPEAIDALEADPDEYVKGSFEVRVGDVVEGPALSEVGIRLKGGTGSFRTLSEKAAFKIKFAEFVDHQKYYGLKKLTLNNMVQDPSMVHEALAYDLFRAMDVPAPRTGYAFTRLNGEVVGLHADIETYDDVSLPRWFESTRHLYEADAPGLDVAAQEDAEEFEVDEGDDDDLTDLEGLISAANDEEGDWSDGLAGLASLEEMTRMWAVERYIGHWDGYAGVAAAFRPNNYYLHSDDPGVFAMLPWGTDQTWADDFEFDEPAGGLLFNRCLDDDSCRALYEQALEQAQGVVADLELEAKAERYAALLSPCQELEEEPRREYSAAEIAAGVAETVGFIDSRPAELADYLENSPPPLAPDGPSPPKEEPCGPDPGAEPPAAGVPPPQDTGGGVPDAVPGLRFGRTRSSGARISTRLAIPGSGRATQVVKVRASGRWKEACSTSRRLGAAGPRTLRCRLARWARKLRRSRPLRLRVVIRFVPGDGPASSVIRRLRLQRLH